MDAFLKPSEGTDATGQPLRLKTAEFYKGLRQHLTPEGIVVINLNVHQGTDDDLATVRGAYPQNVHVQGQDAQPDRHRHLGEDADQLGRSPRARPARWTSDSRRRSPS